MSRQTFFSLPYFLGAIAALTLLASSGALAQSSAHPDIIRLSDGDYFRGTIVEFVKDEYAIIETPSGALRRVEASDAAYIGPAKDEPAAAQSGGDEPAFEEVELPPAPSDAKALELEHAAPDELYREDKVRVRLFSEGERLTLHQTAVSGVIVSAGSRGSGMVHTWTPLCTAPCEAWMAPGYHQRMMIETERGGRAGVREAAIITEPSDLELSYQSKRVARIILLSIGIPLSLAGLSTMMVSALKVGCTYDGDCGLNWGAFIGGAVAFGAGMGMMMSGFSVRDRGKISVHPYGSLGQEGADEPANATH